jgi:hypothetical protein
VSDSAKCCVVGGAFVVISDIIALCSGVCSIFFQDNYFTGPIPGGLFDIGPLSGLDFSSKCTSSGCVGCSL